MDELIDLNFQNYFDGDYNKISAYQGLNHKFDQNHITLGFTVNKSIFAFLYIDLASFRSRREAYFDNLFCAPSMRNQGVGKALIAAGLQRVENLGFRSVSGRIMGPPEHCQQIARMLDKYGFIQAECSDPLEGFWDATMIKTF